jgi:hypothetical protein
MMRKLSAGIIVAVAVLLCSVAYAAPSAAVNSGLSHIVANWSCGCGGSQTAPAAAPAVNMSLHLRARDCGGCGCHSSCGGCGCKCCPAIPEYPMVCVHDHRDMHRDLMSRQHAPWW